MNVKNSALFFVVKFSAFSLAVALVATYMGSAVAKTASISVDKPIRTIVIDAGHGGIDGGAVADDGTLEKDLNLALAKTVERLLISLGADVVMTRTDDVMFAESSSPHKKLDDLTHRIKTTESAVDAVFVSIHMNKFPVQKYSGLQVYYSKNNEESHALADVLQSAAQAYIQPQNARQTKAAGDEIYLLSKLTCPAVLIECGFLSNHDELALLKTEEYRNKLAAVIAVTVTEYVNQVK
ncbi:MAG: N-acetylmuramoyl-L-alanine amidase [Clostridia bacterium]|nr:N-acetylmuramoyl-L-alanine amidase [Clostridia bacterium]